MACDYTWAEDGALPLYSKQERNYLHLQREMWDRIRLARLWWWERDVIRDYYSLSDETIFLIAVPVIGPETADIRTEERTRRKFTKKKSITVCHYISTIQCLYITITRSWAVFLASLSSLFWLAQSHCAHQPPASLSEKFW